MSAKIILSPEISSVVKELLLLNTVLIKSDDNKTEEELLEKILSQLPRGIIGFTYRGKMYLKEQIAQNLPDLEEFILLPAEEEQ